MSVSSGFKFVSIAAAVACLASLASTPARAVVFDFESGTLQGWLTTSSGGGAGSTGVEQHNLSKAAFATQSGSGQAWGIGVEGLAHDFLYSAKSTLSFDMQAVANYLNIGGNVGNSESGVTVSFSNVFNVALGSVSFLNVTTSSWLGSHSFQIDSNQHNYAATMDMYAEAAGIAPGAAIAKISVSFFSAAQTICPYNCYNTTATVWFDNVKVGAVPEPETYALFPAGLGIVALASRRLHVRRICVGISAAVGEARDKAGHRPAAS